MGELATSYGSLDKPALEAQGVRVSVAGRMMLKRVMGKASFATLQDGSGRLQVYVSNDVTGAEAHEQFKHWDLGDIVGVEGALFKTNKGELTVNATALRLLVKALRPLPEKFHGLADQEMRYRQRYVDLIVTPESRRTFAVRSRVIQALREAMNADGYLEVETPMMQAIPGGAIARPFKTHHNALDMDLYLRIAPELYLKRLVVGGFERVYEINRNFRNEGVSTQHNPEFTMLEFYQAYADYQDLIELSEALGTTITPRTDVATVARAAAEKGIQSKGGAAWVLWKDVFEELVEPTLVPPTFVTDFPIELSPLAKKKRDDPLLVDRFELFIGRRELANAYSELNDPIDQLGRFREQAALQARGDDEAHWLDEDYVRALEYGMPPAAGEGIGIDRLVMLFADQPSIREVILFPHLRPEAGSP